MEHWGGFAAVDQQGAGLHFRVVQQEDLRLLVGIFHAIDETYFRPHPFTADEAKRIADYLGLDVYALLIEDGRPVAYGMLRGFDEGYAVPSLGIAVANEAQGRGLGRLMMKELHSEARRRGATVVRLRVHPANTRARRLYESLGYVYAGEDRGEHVMLLGLGGASSEPAMQEGGAMHGRILDCGAPEWENVLGDSAHDFYHLPSYVELCAVDSDARPCALHVSDGHRTMLLPLLIRRIAQGTYDAVSPYGFPGPVGRAVSDAGFLQVALVAGLQTLREAGVVCAFLRLHPILNPATPEGIGVLVRHGSTVSIDLGLSEEDLWSQMRRNHRADISRATRLGYVATMDEQWLHFERFKSLYWGTMQRRGADAFYLFNDEYFDALRTSLGERMHLCVVEGDDGVVAAGIFVEVGGIVEAHLVGTEESSGRIQPTKLMFHFASLWAKARGAKVLHLGGGVGGAADSLLHFKEGFSPIRHPFSTLRAVIDEAEYVRLVSERDPSLDPHDRTGFFPLYRVPPGLLAKQAEPGTDPRTS